MILKRDKDCYTIRELAQLIAVEEYLDQGVAVEFAKKLEDEIQAALLAGKTISIGGYVLIAKRGKRFKLRTTDKLKRLARKFDVQEDIKW